jgi:hypothetical protein
MYQVWGQRDIRWLPQGMVGGKGFDVVHVEAGAGDSAGPQSLDQG